MSLSSIIVGLDLTPFNEKVEPLMLTVKRGGDSTHHCWSPTQRWTVVI